MDAYLIEGLRQSNERVFAELYEQYHSKLYFYFLSKLYRSDIAAELVQTSFIKCWQYRHNFAPDLKLSHQLFRIAKTSFIDFIRQKAKERLVSLEDCSSLDDVQEPFPVTDNRLTKVTATLDQIPPERRKIIKFRLEGMTNKEIADQLGISKKTVENQLNKAVKEIRSKLTSPSELSFAIILISLIQTAHVTHAANVCIN